MRARTRYVGHRNWLYLALLFLMSALTITAAACGDDDDEASKTPEATKSPATSQAASPSESPSYSASEIAMIEKAFGTSADEVQADPLWSPIIGEALSRAALTLSDADKQLALKCWKDDGCDTGRGDLVVGYVDGFGDNSWRYVTKMEAILQLLSYPQVKKIIYMNSHFVLDEEISNIRSLIAQDVDIIAGMRDFGDAELPVIREATQAGITVVDGWIPLDSAEPGDLLTQVIPNLCDYGKRMASVVIDQLGGKGNVAILGGPPGSAYAKGWGDCAEQEVKKAGMNVIGRPDTMWTQQGALEATSGLLAANATIDAVIHDYSNAMEGVVRAFEQANRPIPLLVTGGEDNGLFCEWQKVKGSNPNFRIFFARGANWAARIMITAAIDSRLNAANIQDRIYYPMPLREVQDSDCDPTLPPDYASGHLIPTDLIQEMFK